MQARIHLGIPTLELEVGDDQAIVVSHTSRAPTQSNFHHEEEHCARKNINIRTVVAETVRTNRINMPVSKVIGSDINVRRIRSSASTLKKNYVLPASHITFLQQPNRETRSRAKISQNYPFFAWELCDRRKEESSPVGENSDMHDMYYSESKYWQ